MVINYIIGKLVSVHKGYIILENNYIGYKLYPVDDMRNYNIGKVLKLYIIDETHCSWAYPWEQKEDETSERLKDLSKAMRTLGYNKEEIAKVNTLDYTQCPELSDMISEAIKYLSRNPL